jgi:hypothetical protein
MGAGVGKLGLGLALLVSALLVGGWDALTWYRRVLHARTIWVSEYLFVRQDVWVLGAYALALLLLGLWTLRAREKPQSVFSRRQSATGPWLVLVCAIACVIVARLGRDLVFHGYSPSRDEVMVELASAYLAQGRMGWPVPAEWQAFHRAMMPEFYSPYGANSHWTSIYLPVHAAITAVFRRAGDAALAAPVMLGLGLAALWRISGRLFGTRMDARIVTLVMALSSAQLLVTAMTPYAMTSHFAFNLIWLALVLRDKPWSHALAGLVAILAAGLHQWHFPLLFIGPFILWMALRRQWVAAGFHILIVALVVMVWAKLWPFALAGMVGPPPPSDTHRTAGAATKIFSLFNRLDGWQPLLNTARLFAWNNLLLLPLALLAPFAVRWRPVIRTLLSDPPIVLPLLMGVGAGLLFSIYQGYGWGFRYMHGQIGPLCLLAGFGWMAASARAPVTARSVMIVGTAASLLAGLWLTLDSERYVRGFARSMDAIRSADADVVLVDIRGGYYLNDFVRFDDGVLRRPAVMGLHMLDDRQLDTLCASHSVAIADTSLFWPLGVHPVRLRFGEAEMIEAKLDHLAAIKCGVRLTASRTTPRSSVPPHR